jgi:hypothetical protein
MLQVQWVKSQTGTWLPFETCGLPQATVEGVYVIWRGGNPSPVVRLGQGVIVDRIAKHRRDQAILAYRPFGLWVTWADVPAQFRDGVERYLADYYQPLIGDAYPNVPPIPVNEVA